MHCTHCDTVNASNAHYCTNCGNALNPQPELPATQQTVQLAPSATAGDPMISAGANPPVTLPPSVHVNVTIQAPVAIPTPAPVAPPAPTPMIVVTQNTDNGPGCLIRAVYFVFIGLSLGLLWTVVAWFALVTIIGLPIGLMMLNRLPQVMTLKPVRKTTQVTVNGNVVVVGQGTAPQRSFLIRAIYFVLIGWWLSALWLGVAWGLIGATFGLALPLSFWMFDRTPAIVTLARQ